MENNIELTEKHESEKEDLDEENKAMKLFNLGDKKDGKGNKEDD